MKPLETGRGTASRRRSPSPAAAGRTPDGIGHRNDEVHFARYSPHERVEAHPSRSKFRPEHSPNISAVTVSRCGHLVDGSEFYQSWSCLQHCHGTQYLPDRTQCPTPDACDGNEGKSHRVRVTNRLRRLSRDLRSSWTASTAPHASHVRQLPRHVPLTDRETPCSYPRGESEDAGPDTPPADSR